MNLGTNYTRKTTEALQSAIKLAQDNSHQAVDCPHVFLSLLAQEDSLVLAILKKLEVNTGQLREELEDELEKIPRVEGGTTEAIFHLGR